MVSKRFTEEFKLEAIKQITERHLPVAEVSARLGVSTHSLYALRTSPTSARQREDSRLLGLIKQFWLESGGVYGYRKVTDDMRDTGERCSRHRVYRLMRTEGLRSQTGYRRRPGTRYSRPSTVVPNHVAQQFNVTEPNKIWVTDITYICTH